MSDHYWQRNKTATLKDIAQDVGVSESLVSYVLNGTRSGARVSAATRERIREAGERLGYRPNSLARSLNSGQTHQVGFYSGRMRIDARNVFFAELIGGIMEGAMEAGLNLVLNAATPSTEHALDMVSNRAVDGLLVYAWPDDPILRVLDQLVVPAVAIADRIQSIPSALTDDIAGGRLQADHLYQRGHRHILAKHLCQPPASAVSRLAGLTDRAAELGMRVTLSPNRSDWTLGLQDIDLSTLTEGPDRATAVVGWNDCTADQVCATLEAKGLRTPYDVAVIGFDGFTRNFPLQYDITTVCAHWEEVGRAGLRVLTDVIAGRPAPMTTLTPISLYQGVTT